MPTAGKIFYYLDPKTIEEIHETLRGFTVNDTVEEGEISLDLKTDIGALGLLEDGDLQGVWKQDEIISLTHRGQLTYHLITKEFPFVFTLKDEQPYLIVLGKKQLANTVANKLSETIWGEIGHIIEPRMNPKALRGYYEGSDGTKILLFENLDTPNLDKWTGYGEDVVQTDLYGKYVNVGSVRWVVMKSLKKGYTVGISSDCGVTLFNRVDTINYVEYIKDEIIPLTLVRRE